MGSLDLKVKLRKQPWRRLTRGVKALRWYWKLRNSIFRMAPNLTCVPARSLQSCLTLCDPMDYSLPASSVYWILQARILEWAAMPSSRGSSQPRDRTCFSYEGSLPLVPPGREGPQLHPTPWNGRQNSLWMCILWGSGFRNFYSIFKWIMASKWFSDHCYGNYCITG